MAATEKITVDIPTLEALIFSSVSRALDIRDIAKNTDQTPTESPVGIARAAQITGLSKAGIYSLTRKKLIPFHKAGGRGGKLLFFEHELLTWVRSGDKPAVVRHEKEVANG